MSFHHTGMALASSLNVKLAKYWLHYVLLSSSKSMLFIKDLNLFYREPKESQEQVVQWETGVQL